MSFSVSKVKTFNDCPFKYRLKYIDHLEPLPNMSASNPLFLGTAVHTGIEERSIEKAIENYKSNYPEIGPEHEIEIMKLETILKKAIEQIPEGEYELKLRGEDGFVGYIDCLVKIDEGLYDLIDFKYSNNTSHYLQSEQVHVYKYYYEKLTGNTIRNLYYAMIPKSKEVLTEGISIDDTKKLVLESLSDKDVSFEKVEYDPKQIRFFFARKALMDKAQFYEKRYTSKCKWCDYAAFCKSNGLDMSGLVQREESDDDKRNLQ